MAALYCLNLATWRLGAYRNGACHALQRMGANMVITCINYDALNVHSCLTTAYVYDAMLGIVLSGGSYLIHGIIIKWAIHGALLEAKHWIDRHPLRRINFWHKANAHPQPSIIVCEDGLCKMVRLP